MISGELGPGEVYSARQLAEKFGVSATPVREALLALTNEGLLEPVRNRGVSRRAPHRRRTGQPAGVAAPHRGTNGAQGGAGRVDIEFHCLQMSIAGNPQLVAAVRSFRVRSRLYGIAELVGDDPTEEVNEALTRDHLRMSVPA